MQILIIFTIIILIFILAYFTKEGFKINNKDEEYDLIKKYLLNESPLYGKNKPKIWIHSVYNVNTRNSNDFNQSYIELTIKSVIEHCANNFNILLINDETFSKLIPNWKWGDMSNIPDPQKTHIRQRGLLQLLYYYGGIIVPNSFICFRNLESLFKSTPFVIETINRTLFNSSKTFTPSIEFIGVRNKRDLSIYNFMNECFTSDIITEFDMRYNGDTSNKRDWETVGIEIDIIGKSRDITNKYVKNNDWFMWSGDLFGIKTNTDGKPILIEDLMEEDYLDLSPDIYGILIDSNEILRRPKYNWLNYIKPDSSGLLNKCNNILSKYLNKAIIDGLVITNKKEQNVNVI